TELETREGAVFGLRADDFELLVSLDPRPGLVPLATTTRGAGLPRVRRDTDSGTWVVEHPSGQPPALIEIVPHARRYAARLAGILDTTRLARRRVIIVGGGSIGSPTALYLARAGVGSLVLIDGDMVTLEILTRSGFAIDDLGMPKVDALARHLVRAN